jgi:hypothetical protein
MMIIGLLAAYCISPGEMEYTGGNTTLGINIILKQACSSGQILGIDAISVGSGSRFHILVKENNILRLVGVPRASAIRHVTSRKSEAKERKTDKPTKQVQ